jgi:NAD(P)H-quinone oxidoreductase subunit 6
MSASLLEGSAFYLLAVLAVAGALIVAASKNIVHSAFALLATFLGVAGLYVLLAADLIAVVQLLVYVGGILVLILFAVMLTSRIVEADISNPSLGALGGLFALVVVCGPLLWVAPRFPAAAQTAAIVPTTAKIGGELLGPYVLPFEVVSVLLVAALVGAVTLAKSPPRRRQTPKSPGAAAGAKTSGSGPPSSRAPRRAPAQTEPAPIEGDAVQVPAHDSESPTRDTLESAITPEPPEPKGAA